MKKPICLTLAVLFALAVFGCKTPDKEPEKKEDPKTLDPRLVGGRWYFTYMLEEPSSYSYYKFTSDSKFICSDEDDLNPYEVVVYSKNGIVYEKETNTDILHYKFNNTFPYPRYYLYTGLNQLADLIADYGDLITCTASGIKSLYPNDISFEGKFLVRFNDDGTSYRNYFE